MTKRPEELRCQIRKSIPKPMRATPSHLTGIGRDTWREIIGSFGPCRVHGPAGMEFLDAARDLACIVEDEGEVDLFVAVDEIPKAALRAPRIVFVATRERSVAAGDDLLAGGVYRRSIHDVLLHDRFGGRAVYDVRTYERDIEVRVRGESRRSGRLADESIRRHMAAAWQIKLGDVVLDIAGGRGFRGYVIAGLSSASEVVTLLAPVRVDEARARFDRAAAGRLRVLSADGLADRLTERRYECIVCRHRQITSALLDAVAPGGRLVVLGHVERDVPGFRRDVDPWAGMSVWMRCPLASASIPVEDHYFLSGRPGTPKALDPSWMHENPGIAIAMVTEPSRMRSASSLSDLAMDVVDATRPGSKDGISALVVIGHRLVEGLDVMDESEWLERAAGHRAAAGTDAPYLRWMASLDFVEARIHETRGRMRKASSLYRSVAEMDAVSFHPSLLTKTAEAAIRAARLEMAFGDLDGARALLRKAVATTRSTLGSDPAQIMGEDGALTDFYMMEASATLQMAAYAATALNLDQRSGSEALRRYLARPPAPRTIFGGPVEAEHHAAGPVPIRLAARIASRLRRMLYSIHLMRPPEVVTQFAMLPFD